jgi:GH15 family glucan-1,4-alpha-glucosidase
MSHGGARDGRPSIGAYGFLSDCSSAALVSRDGSVDWWCSPRFDSPSVFGRLLGPDAGHWSLAPVSPGSSERAYLADTLVLRTVHTSAGGVVAVTEALALGAGGHDLGRRGPPMLLRVVQGLSGQVRMATTLAPRPEYGRTEPHWRRIGGGVEARGGPLTLTCLAPVDWVVRAGAATAEFDVRAGDRVELRLVATPAFGTAPGPGDVAGPGGEAGIAGTVESWRSWAAEHTGYDGAYAAEVRRSSLVLQGLTFGPSGAVVAAATTSLPEAVGGHDNWDYRFAWLRDLSFTARALWLAACPSEPNALLDWVTTAIGRLRDETVQIAYGVEGERDLDERRLPHLPGHRGSRPVRVGNAAAQQRQLDVLGEVVDAAALLHDPDRGFPPGTADLVVALADRAADDWTQPDSGMWEARDADRHYTSSKVWCWVALDRAVALAPALGPAADPQRWSAAAGKVRAAVLEQAWSERLGAYAGALGSDRLDASVLLLPLVGFLPVTDERMAATVEVIAAGLGEHGLVRRWDEDRSGFLICTYWLVECLAMAGQADRADALFRLATGHANDLGLLAEEADPGTGAALGNVPQAFSHVGLINAAWRLAHPAAQPPRASGRRRSAEQPGSRGGGPRL